MKTARLTLLALTTLSLSPALRAQVIDGSDVQKEVSERAERVGKLTLEEQLKLRAAQEKAATDPDVQAALKKRNEAIEEFRAAIRAAMIKADPTVGPILDRVLIKSGR